MNRYFEYVHGTSRKFWRIEITGSTGGSSEVWTTYGRIGSAGTRVRLAAGSPLHAHHVARERVQSKLDKGYVETGDGALASVPVATLSPRQELELVALLGDLDKMTRE